MSQQTTKGRYKAVGPLSAAAMVTLCWATLGGMVDNPIFVIAEPMFITYENEFISNTILTGPLLVGMVMMLLNIPLMRKFSKKTILVAIYSLFVICALGESLLYENMYAMLVFRMLGGITYGLGMATSIAFISESYRNYPKKASLYVGVANAVSMFGGALMTYIAGLLAVGSWGNALKLLWIFIPLLICIIIFVPKTPPSATDEERSPDLDSGEKGSLAGIIPMLISLALLSLGFFFALSQNSFVIEERGFSSLFGGNYVGIFGLVINAASGVGALSSGIITNAIGRKTTPLCYILGGIGFALLGFVDNWAAFLAGGALVGISFGVSFSYFQLACGQKVENGRESDAIMIVFCVNSLFSFLSSYIVSALIAITGATMRLDIIAIAFAAYAVGTILSLAVYIVSHKQNA